MKKLIIGFVLIVGIAALILPKFIGSQGTKMHNDFFQEQAQQLVPGVVIESEKIHTGWFNSEGQQRIKLSKTFLSKVLPGVSSIELENDIDVLVDTKFHHGPFAFTSFSGEGRAFSPVLAVAESTFIIETDGKKTALPGKLYTQVNPTASGGKAKYIADAYSQKSDEGQIDFEGLVLDFDFSDNGNALDGKGSSGKLSILGSDGESIVLNQLQFEADLEDINGLMFGGGSLDIADFAFNDGHGQSFTLNNVAMKAANRGNATSMKSDLQLNVGEFVVSGMTFEDFVIDYTIDNIDTQAMAALQEQSRLVQEGGTPDQAEMMEELKNLVERSPKIDINEISVNTEQGKVIADFHLGLPNEVDMGFFPLSLLSQIEGDANIRIPMLVLQMIDGVKPGIADQAYALSQGGMLELQGDDYVAVFKMRDGEVSVNGKPMPIPGMF